MKGGGFGLSQTARLALLQRLSKRREGTDAPLAEDAADPRGFAGLPGLRDFELIRTAGEVLGLENPFFRPHEGIAGAITRIGGRDYLNFASYNYLGLNGDPRVAAVAKAAIDRHGVSASASRMVSGERPVHGALEAALAENYGAEACLAFVSGHATNVTVIGHLVGPHDLIVHDAAIHNSCAEGARLSGARRVAFAHNDWRAAERETPAARREAHAAGDRGPLQHGRRRAGARALRRDRAPARGLADGGRGAFARRPRRNRARRVRARRGRSGRRGHLDGHAVEDALGLRRLHRGAAGADRLPPPFRAGLRLFGRAVAAAALESLAILRAKPERVARLQANATLFCRLARERGLDTGTSAGLGIVPVIVGTSIGAARLSAALFARGINVQPILFPAVPEAGARLRFFLSADHTEEQVREAVEATAAALAGAAPVELPG
jgi:7-keto-8-aminopelargonate synthetase-like enzyme